jgi:hypothetical protein
VANSFDPLLTTCLKLVAVARPRGWAFLQARQPQSQRIDDMIGEQTSNTLGLLITSLHILQTQHNRLCHLILTMTFYEIPGDPEHLGYSARIGNGIKWGRNKKGTDWIVSCRALRMFTWLTM